MYLKIRCLEVEIQKSENRLNFIRRACMTKKTDPKSSIKAKVHTARVPCLLLIAVAWVGSATSLASLKKKTT